MRSGQLLTAAALSSALAGPSLGCRPRLDPSLIRLDGARPAPAPIELRAASAERRPGWLDGGRGPEGVIFVGRGEAPGLEGALAAAERDLARRVAQALGVEVDARYTSESRAGDGESSSAHGAVRIRDGARAVTPDGRYWERTARGRVEQHQAYVRLEVAHRELLRTRAARRAPTARSSRPNVVLRFEGPRARALEREIFYATMGAPRFEVVDPGLVDLVGAQDSEGLRRSMGSEYVVLGRVTTEPLSMTLEVVGGGTSRIEARSWSELATTLPVALPYLLFGSEGGPMRTVAP